jgi:hypothetical protein
MTLQASKTLVSKTKVATRQRFKNDNTIQTIYTVLLIPFTNLQLDI